MTTEQRIRMVEVDRMRKYLVEKLGITPDTLIYGDVEYTGSGGRKIRLYVIHEGEIVNITGAVAILCALRRNIRKQLIYVRGTGFSAMDSVAHSMLPALFPGSDCAKAMKWRPL